MPTTMNTRSRPITATRYVRHSIRRSVSRVSQIGGRTRCALCQSRIHRYAPHGLDHPVLEELDIVGGGRREQGSCPVCLCTDRDRLVYLYLKHETNILRPGVSVLHVAPEQALGRVLRRVEGLRYLSADLQSPDAMVHLDLCSMDMPDNSFDLIVCNHVLEHIPDDRAAMSEIYRTLKPGGFALLQTPISRVLEETFEDASVVDPSERERAFGQRDHVRVYGQDYADRLAGAGFDVEEYCWTDSDRLAEPGKSACLDAREILFLGHKRWG